MRCSDPQYLNDFGDSGYPNTPDVASCAAQCNAIELCRHFLWGEGQSDPCRLSYSCHEEDNAYANTVYQGFYKSDPDAGANSCGMSVGQTVYVGCGTVWFSERDLDEQCADGLGSWIGSWDTAFVETLDLYFSTASTGSSIPHYQDEDYNSCGWHHGWKGIYGCGKLYINHDDYWSDCWDINNQNTGAANLNASPDVVT